MSSFSVGSVISFSYPRHNYHGIPQSFESRRLKIESIRSIGEQPLDPVTYDLNPLLKRGRTLVKGLDLDKGEERSFYVESMEDLKVIPEHEVTDFKEHVVQLLDEDSTPEIVFRGSALKALSWMREWLRKPLGLTVAIVPPERSAA